MRVLEDPRPEKVSTNLAQRAGITDFEAERNLATPWYEVVSRLGLEPRALALKGRCSTD